MMLKQIQRITMNLRPSEILLIYSAWSMDATNLDRIDHGADSVFCDVVKAQLKGRHHHPGLQLAPRG